MWRVGLGSSLIILLVGLWEVAARAGWINFRIFGQPSRIWSRAVTEFQGPIWPHITATLSEIALALSLAIAIGGTIGVLMGWYRIVSRALDVTITIWMAFPIIAALPVIVAWFGIGFQIPVIIVFTTTVFPTIVTTAAGVRTVNPDLVRMARHLGATDSHILRTIALPTALAYLVAGVRVAIGRAVGVVVVGEWLGSPYGLGSMTFSAFQNFKIDLALLGATTMAVLGITLTAVARMIERRFSAWRT